MSTFAAARRRGREITLTTTEYKLLLHLMRSAGRVVPKRLLTERVWGYDFDGNDNVLEVCAARVRCGRAGSTARSPRAARGPDGTRAR